MIYWFRLPEEVQKRLQIDSVAYPCIDVEEFNALAKSTKWINTVENVKKMYAILGRKERVFWYNLPQKIEELIMRLEIYEC